MEEHYEKIETQEILSSHLEKEKQLSSSFLHVARKEEEYWHLKSRSTWLKAGDQNTSYFHKEAKAREIKNKVKEINIPLGETIKTFEEIKQESFSHFQDLYSEENNLDFNSAHSFLSTIPKVIIEDENLELTKVIIEREVRNAIWSLDSDKAPSPDGFSINFFRLFWNLIKFDLLKILNWSKNKNKIGGGTNSSFLSLIPKDSQPNSFARFRPISLCNSAYKILTNLIEKRLSSLCQGLFLKIRVGSCKIDTSSTMLL